MTSSISKNYTINLSFTSIKLPPVIDILILAKKYPQGKTGVSEAFKLIAPDEFEMFPVEDDEVIDAVLINKKILSRLSKDKVIDTLRKNVFPYITKGEAVNVNFSISIQIENIKGEM
jgi:hypothetical protein